MGRNGESLLGDPTFSSEVVRQAVAEAVAEALLEHKREGNPIAVWDRENNRVRIVAPEDIVVPDVGERA